MTVYIELEGKVNGHADGWSDPDSGRSICVRPCMREAYHPGLWTSLLQTAPLLRGLEGGEGC